ncbi:MAG: PD40 domain-containing protein, partial [Acidobacteria bacterium]|nr:PD40 domain-containing protein [Acidobacteriota bacterium]
GAEPRRLTTSTADEGGRLAWSPDGRLIAFIVGDEVKYSAYDQAKLAVIPATGGEARILTAALDRPVGSAVWSADGASLTFTITDDRTQHLGTVSSTGGAVRRLIHGRQVIANPSSGTD